MKINRIIWRNFKGLPDGEIVANGRNVTISGRNGTGKSSIANILPFVLFGKISAKGFDAQGSPVKLQIPSATIEFDNATLKRTVTADNKNRTFVDGEEVLATTFNAAVFNLTGGTGNLLFNPFEFPNLHWSAQRDFLLKHFAPKIRFADAAALSDELKRLRKDASTLPARIEENRRQLAKLELPNLDVDELVRQIDNHQAEISKLQPQNSAAQKSFLASQIRQLTKIREELLQRYFNVKDTCPTCGAPLPNSKIAAAQKRIVAQGKEVASQLEHLRNELETLQSKEQFDAERALKIKQLQDKVRELNAQLAAVKQAENFRKRLEQLTADEKSLNARIAELEGRIAAAEETRREQMADSEDAVNSQFRFVKFKLFKLLANGEARETCEPMIAGVPFSSLSNGEKFKAACDILNALQVKFGREMPLMIDNAECYTSNSLVELPNQKFLFKVTEADLKIFVDDGRLAA